MKKIIVAIDGYSSCGKSTMAKQLAQALGYVFIDSGAMYRAITLYLIQHSIDPKDSLSVAAALDNINIHFGNSKGDEQASVYLNNIDVSKAIRGMEVAAQVSEVATIGSVRSFAVAQQQAMGEQKGLVMDGRDVGTAVFPEAELKIFVTASIEVRTQRRYDELKLTQTDISFDEVRENLLKRDHIDTTRAISPLKKAADAIVLDNSDISREEQLAIVKAWAEEKIKG